MNSRALDCKRIFERAKKTVSKLLFAAGQRRDAALAGLPVAGRRIEQNLPQAMLFELRGQSCRRIFVREKVLDGGESIARGGAKAVKEIVLRVHHGQVGGKTRHDIHSIDW